MANKKIIWGLGVLVIFGLVLIWARGSEDSWICQDGQWVKHGNPSAAQPISPCVAVKENYGVVVDTPTENELIMNPVHITGRAPGSWFFEASAPAQILDASGKTLGGGIIQAKGEWMTDKLVEFAGDVKFGTPSTGTGKIILMNDNPSGLSENSKKVEIPVKFAPVETMTVKVFFGNNQKNPGAADCGLVFPVERVVPKTVAVGFAALQALRQGPTEEEKQAGYYSSLNPNTRLHKLWISQGVATVDWFNDLTRGVGGSCRVIAMAAEITETLKQFPTVKSVKILVDGKEDQLQP